MQQLILKGPNLETFFARQRDLSPFFLPLLFTIHKKIRLQDWKNCGLDPALIIIDIFSKERSPRFGCRFLTKVVAKIRLSNAQAFFYPGLLVHPALSFINEKIEEKELLANFFELTHELDLADSRQWLEWENEYYQETVLNSFEEKIYKMLLIYCRKQTFPTSSAWLLTKGLRTI